jgi:hypothetical protein
MERSGNDRLLREVTEGVLTIQRRMKGNVDKIGQTFPLLNKDRDLQQEQVAEMSLCRVEEDRHWIHWDIPSVTSLYGITRRNRTSLSFDRIKWIGYPRSVRNGSGHREGRGEGLLS